MVFSPQVDVDSAPKGYCDCKVFSSSTHVNLSGDERRRDEQLSRYFDTK